MPTVKKAPSEFRHGIAGQAVASTGRPIRLALLFYKQFSVNNFAL